MIDRTDEAQQTGSKVEFHPPSKTPDYAKTGGSIGNIAIPDGPLKRSILEAIADPHAPSPVILTKKYTRRLDQFYQASCYREWGFPKTPEQVEQNWKQWQEEMNNWWDGLKAPGQEKMRQDCSDILVGLGIPVNTGTAAFNWAYLKNYFPEGKPDFEAFFNKIKQIPGIESKMHALAKITGVFGEDVRHELLRKVNRELWDPGRSAELKREEQQSQKTIGKSIAQERQDMQDKQEKPLDVHQESVLEAKQQRFQEKLRVRNNSVERVLNGIIFDTSFTKEQRDQIRSTMAFLPVELLKQVERVKITAAKGLDMAYEHIGKYRKGALLIARESLTPKANQSQKEYLDGFTKSISHELAGHGMSDLIYSLDKNTHKQLIKMWIDTLQANPGLLLKDNYSSRIISGKSQTKNTLRYNNSIYAAEDEFWADRMAEYAVSHISRNPVDALENQFNRKTQFSEAEERAIKQVCEQSFQMFIDVVQRKIK